MQFIFVISSNEIIIILLFNKVTIIYFAFFSANESLLCERSLYMLCVYMLYIVCVYMLNGK